LFKKNTNYKLQAKVLIIEKDENKNDIKNDIKKIIPNETENSTEISNPKEESEITIFEKDGTIIIYI